MRKKNDLYTTQTIAQSITHVLLDTVNIVGTVLEPCAGPQYMSSTLQKSSHISKVITNDVDRQFHTDYCEDAIYRDSILWDGEYDWIVTNPPYSGAFEILQHAYECARVGVAFFLLQTWDEPNYSRGNWLQTHVDHQTHRIVVHPRPNFRKGEINPDTGKGYGGYSCSFAWYIWQKQWSWSQQGLQCPFVYARNVL